MIFSIHVSVSKLNSKKTHRLHHTKSTTYPTSRFFCRRTSGFKSKRWKVSCNTWQPRKAKDESMRSWWRKTNWWLKAWRQKLIDESNRNDKILLMMTNRWRGCSGSCLGSSDAPKVFPDFRSVPRVSPDDPVQTLWQRKAHDSPARGGSWGDSI